MPVAAMKRVPIQPDFYDWRNRARIALQEGYGPDEIDFLDATVPTPLELMPSDGDPTGAPIVNPHTSSAYLQAAEAVAVHRDPTRWNLLYRVLYRMQGNRDLLKIEIDTDVAQFRRMEQQVRRDLHKMHAFVRFRKVEPNPMEAANPFAGGDTAEHFVAWYQPDHRILHLAAPFFAERFAPMHWAILTPDESVSWDPATRLLTFFEGLPRESAPQADELETLWRSYYSSIFNPARVNPEVMRSEMPVRYWKNLPEVEMLPELLSKASMRVETMVQVQQQSPTAQPYVPQIHTVEMIKAALAGCRGCDLYRHATQAVPGHGALFVSTGGAQLMLVGEQPGDQEDVQGLPFVGPAGKVLDGIMAELGIDRSKVYVTNAVKHFKFVQRGKLRLHQNPRMSEITACRPWLLAEIDAVKPSTVLCLGASAAKSLLGGTFALMRDHGKVLSSPYAAQVVATVHPSTVLRARDDRSREQLRTFLKDDLALAYQASLQQLEA